MDEFEKKKRESSYSEKPLDDMFKAFCMMDPTSNAMELELIPLSQCNDWLKKARVLDMQTVTTTDTGLCFFKFRKRAINYEQFLQFLEDLANVKKLDLDEMKMKMQYCHKPSTVDDKKKKKQRKD